jgi:phosphoribosylformimino-5-aminoimidazole carboxamide ribotide isomerase
VRLKRGEMDQATVYADDPAAQAASFAAAGFAWVHVVDLDGAFAGRPANAEAVRAILGAARGLSVQLGGGIRDMATAEAWLAAGVTRIILGSAAGEGPGIRARGLPCLPGARRRSASTRGTATWRRKAGPRQRHHGHRTGGGFADSGACAIITPTSPGRHADRCERRGHRALARAVTIPVIASAAWRRRTTSSR